MKLKFLFLIFLFLLSVELAYSHNLPQVSYNTIEIRENTVRFINSNDGNSYFLLAADKLYRQDIINNIQVKNNGKPCQITNFIEPNTTKPVFFIARCEEQINYLEFKDTFLTNNSIDKIYFVNYNNITETFSGKEVVEFNITISSSEAEKTGDSKFSLFTRYFKLGVEHILSGPDHIFFILGYILLALTLSGLLKGITGFTVSHSATLTLAALGLLLVPAKIVEPLIALSIAVVALLSLLKIAKSWFIRFGIIFFFGLFHGLGFAGSIAEVGFPKEGFISALLGFSLGIEIGQLLIVIIVFPLLMYLDKNYAKFSKYFRLGMGFIILIGGLYWFIQRLFFL